MGNHLLSVVVPVYEEAARIQTGELDRLVVSLQKQTRCWELVVVDDGSSDSTPELVEQLVHRNHHVRLLRELHCGKGFAVLAGMLAAKGEYILFTDLDQATPIRELDRLLPWFEHNYDIVVGTRGIRRKMAPFSRKCVSYGYILLRSIIIGSLSPVDSQCGFKAFVRRSLQDIIENLHLYHFDNRLPVQGRKVTPGFDVELLLVARQLGYSMKSVPVDWSYHHCRGMTLSVAAWQGLTDLLRIRIALKQGKYNFSC